MLGLIRKWNEVFKEGDEGEMMQELYDRLSKSEFLLPVLRRVGVWKRQIR